VAVYPASQQPHPSPTKQPTHPPVKPPTKPPVHAPVHPPPSKRYPPITWPALDYDFAEDNDPEKYKGNCYDRDYTYGVDAQVTSDKTCIDRDHAYCNIAYTEPGGKCSHEKQSMTVTNTLTICMIVRTHIHFVSHRYTSFT
jgi:hypothetical protein